MEVDVAGAAATCDDGAPSIRSDEAVSDAPSGGDDRGDGDDFVTVAKSDQVSREDARLHVEVHGRHLAIARTNDRLYAMDATCYHMGAPLLHGEIEDVPGHGACIVCPWHHYQISMSTGERLYQDMHRKTCTLPKKQRVHEIREVDGEVQVRLSGGGKPPSPPEKEKRPQPHEVKYEWESDRYAFKPPPPSQALRSRVLQALRSRVPQPREVPPRSAQPRTWHMQMEHTRTAAHSLVPPSWGLHVHVHAPSVGLHVHVHAPSWGLPPRLHERSFQAVQSPGRVER